jgi:hypothetical protein
MTIFSSRGRVRITARTEAWISPMGQNTCVAPGIIIIILSGLEGAARFSLFQPYRLGDRPMAGQRPLESPMEVRILLPQPTY